MIAKYRPLFAPIAVIAAGIALAGLFWYVGQPHSSHSPHPAVVRAADYTPPPTATPIYVTTLPGLSEWQIRDTPAVINCEITPMTHYTVIRHLWTQEKYGARSRLWNHIRTTSGCEGWIEQEY